MKLVYFQERFMLFILESIDIRFNIIPYIAISQTDFDIVDKLFKKKHSGAFDCQLEHLLPWLGTPLFKQKAQEYSITTEAYTTKSIVRSLSQNLNLN